MTPESDLTALASVGGFFALRRGTPPSRTAVPLARAYTLLASGDDPLTFRVEKVASALRAPEKRVAASIAHLGLTARVWSVALGSAALYGAVPELSPERLHWDPDASAPDDLWLAPAPPPSEAARPADPARPADAGRLAELVLDTHLTPLAAALGARYAVAPGLLRGNAGSALTGAARELDRWARRNARPDTAARTRALTAALFEHPLLRDTGTLTPGAGFRRRSCCLYYRIPGAGLCGDCCFDRPPSRPARPR
ncbi:(2Fe-2S)-binding protein [Streptomyces sp. NPDC002004]